MLCRRRDAEALMNNSGDNDDDRDDEDDDDSDIDDNDYKFSHPEI
jgi:hypothetical protein